MKRAVLISLLTLLSAIAALMVWALWGDYPVAATGLIAGDIMLVVGAWLVAKKRPLLVIVSVALILLVVGALVFFSPAPMKHRDAVRPTAPTVSKKKPNQMPVPMSGLRPAMAHR